MKILNSCRISDFNRYNRDYPINFVVDCLIHGLYRKSRWRKPNRSLVAYNTPVKWYAYEIKNPAEAFKFSVSVLRKVIGRRIKHDDIRHLFRDDDQEVTIAKRTLIIASAIQQFLENQKCHYLEYWLKSYYAPWATAIMKTITK